MEDKKEYFIAAGIAVIIGVLLILWAFGVLSLGLVFPIIIIIGVIFYFVLKRINYNDDIYSGKFQSHFRNKR